MDIESLEAGQCYPLESFSNPKSAEITFLKKILKATIFFFIFTSLILGLFLLNIHISQKHSIKSFKDIVDSFFKTDIHDTSFDPIQKIIWVNIAAIASAVALSIASSVAQSLTQNPLADATTLGMTDASIFGIILLKVFFSSLFPGNHYYWAYMFFSFIGSTIVLVFLMYFIKQNNSQNFLVKIILFGLILNIFFRTVIHILKTYRANAVDSIYALSIGGPENTYELFTNQFKVLKIFLIVLLVIFVIAMSLSKKMNVAELGEEQSQSLGINHKILKFISFNILLFTTTIATTLSGNIAFIGLLSTHIVRLIFKTRKYQIILPISSVVATIFFLFSIFLNIMFPKIPSSIFLLFFGSVILCYLSMKK